MCEVANRTREYLSERISFLKKQLETVSVQESTLRFTIKSNISELEQASNVLDGGTSVFEQVKREVAHA